MAKQVGFNAQESECIAGDMNKTVEWNLSKVNQTCENDVVVSNCSVLEETRTYLNPIEESDPDQIASVFKVGFPIACVWVIPYMTSVNTAKFENLKISRNNTNYDSRVVIENPTKVIRWMVWNHYYNVAFSHCYKCRRGWFSHTFIWFVDQSASRIKMKTILSQYEDHFSKFSG